MSILNDIEEISNNLNQILLNNIKKSESKIPEVKFRL